jgi:hypothetical protein
MRHDPAMTQLVGAVCPNNLMERLFSAPDT